MKTCSKLVSPKRPQELFQVPLEHVERWWMQFVALQSIAWIASILALVLFFANKPLLCLLLQCLGLVLAGTLRSWQRSLLTTLAQKSSMLLTESEAAAGALAGVVNHQLNEETEMLISICAANFYWHC